jgi:hypothetical protein
MRYLGWFGALMLLSIGVIAHAQDECTALLQSVYREAQEICLGVGINQACHASGSVELTTRTSIDTTPAIATDAAIPLDAIDTLNIRGVETEIGTYGMVVMLPRLNMLTGALTMIALGDVNVRNLSVQSNDYLALPVRVAEPTGAVVRALPQTEATQVGLLYANNTYYADARLADGSWLRLSTGGWVFGALLRSEADVSFLPVAAAEVYTPALETAYAPMQAISFTANPTPLIEKPCRESPDGGLLLQSPTDMREPSLAVLVNNVTLNFAGTLYLQTTPTNELIVTVLEGRWFDFPDAMVGDRLIVRPDVDGIRLVGAAEEYHVLPVRALPFVLLPRPSIAEALPFSLGGLFTPFVPNTGFLERFAVDGPCVIAANADLNIRSGPGTNYRIRRGIEGNVAAFPDARADNPRGVRWYRIAEGVWVNSQPMFFEGQCDALPEVEPPPPDRDGS